jgi:arylsulfatase A-like enzyme
MHTLLFSAWCGLAAGLVEVAARVLPRASGASDRLYLMSRHFVWLTPISNLALFLVVGLVLTALSKLWPRPGAFLSPRIIVALACVPFLMVAGPGIYTEAWFVFALGIAGWLVPTLERNAAGLTRWQIRTFPVLLAGVAVPAAFVFGTDRLKEAREARRPLPAASSPNVLLIVLDTVRADRLSLYGCERPTTPALERLAQRGIRFDNARASAPWTLPSHASIFTGRWPHELQVRWLAPLGTSFPTLAEYLGSQGYATAGFAANALYCSYDTRIDRGFTHYEDYTLDKLSPLRTACLIDQTLKTVSELTRILAPYLGAGPYGPLREFVSRWFFAENRRDAASINRGFLNWLSARPDPRRPFFAFLNYLDAHSPYVLPDGAAYRFGLKPETPDDLQVVFERWVALDKPALPLHFRQLARDCYDNCIAYLDEQLGRLLDELERRGQLDQTLVVITADHGEGLGEHGLYEHGESLYRTEIHVPLLFVLPARARIRRVVRSSVSLRDVAATVVDLIGLVPGAPFPGRSLARFWCDPAGSWDHHSSDDVISELDGPQPLNPNQGRSPAHRGPLISLTEGEFVYILNQGDGVEELFDVRDDPRELSNRARRDSLRPVLLRFRRRIANIKARPR